MANLWNFKENGLTEKAVQSCLQCLEQLNARLLGFSPGSATVTGGGFSRLVERRTAMADGAALHHEREVQRTVFAYAAAALSAKLMQVDGRINAKERRAFLAMFKFTGMEPRRLEAVLVAASGDSAPVVQYARQLAALFGEAAMREQVLLRFARIAMADAPLNGEEYSVLREVAGVFGLDDRQAALVIDGADGKIGEDPYVLLGISPGADMDIVQRAYHERIRYCHPDRWEGKKEYKEICRVAHRRTVAVNAAYRAVVQEYKQYRLH